VAKKKNTSLLQQSVELAIRKYLDDLDGELPCNLFDTVISEIEQPMLKTVLRHCDNKTTSPGPRHASALTAAPCAKNLSSTISNINTVGFAIGYNAVFSIPPRTKNAPSYSPRTHQCFR
jgi:hypothetical protein